MMRARTRQRARLILAGATIGAIVWLAGSAAADELGPSDHARTKHEMIGVTLDSLYPPVLRISSESTFGWLNYSSVPLRISFDASVARHLMCEGPSIFRVRDGRLESEKVTEASFTSLCHLSRGEYEYTVELIPDGDRVPTLRVGKLIVQSPFGFVSFGRPPLGD